MKTKSVRQFLAVGVAALHFAFCPHMYGELIASESFDYDPGLLHPQYSYGGIGWSAAWENARGFFVAEDESSLACPKESLKVAGSRLAQSGEGYAERRFIFDFQSAKPLWISFLAKKRDNASSYDFLTLQIVAPDTANVVANAGITSLEQFRVSAGEHEGSVSGFYNADEIVMVVVRLEEKGGLFAADLWFVTRGGEIDEASPDLSDQGGVHLEGLGSELRLRIQQGANTQAELDEIRIGTSLQSILK